MANFGGFSPQASISLPNAQATPTDTYASAGIGAAGQAVSTIAQIMANTAARNAALQQAELGRAGSESLAKMQLQAAADLAEKTRAQQAKEYLVQTIMKSAQTPGRIQDLQRANNHTGASLIAQAYGM